jgi:hypothetical protein
MPSRRSLLATVGGSVAVGAIAVGSGRFSVRTHLRDIRLVNNRRDRATVELRLTADGNTTYRSTVNLQSGELIHLPCEWPASAWSYRIQVRLADSDQWESRQWRSNGDLCKKVVVEELDSEFGPVSFYESPGCPPSVETTCG